MGATSIWHWVVVALVIAVLFGSKRIPDLMAELAGGLRAFKRGLDAPDTPAPATTNSTTGVRRTGSNTTGSEGDACNG